MLKRRWQQVSDANSCENVPRQMPYGYQIVSRSRYQQTACTAQFQQMYRTEIYKKYTQQKTYQEMERDREERPTERERAREMRESTRDGERHSQQQIDCHEASEPLLSPTESLCAHA